MTELQQLERSIAESTARSDIEVYCHVESCNARPPWNWLYNLDKVSPAEAADTVAAAARYLELRGILRRDPANPNLVTLTLED